jgi:hypothetical protein
MWTRQLLGWTLLLTACILPNPHVESFIMELKNLAKLSRQLKGGQERNAHNQQVNTGTFQLSRQLRIAPYQLGKTVLKLSRQLKREHERNVHNQQV